MIRLLVQCSQWEQLPVLANFWQVASIRRDIFWGAKPCALIAGFSRMGRQG